MTPFEQILQEGFHIEAEEIEADVSYTYLEDPDHILYRMGVSEDGSEVSVCFKHPGYEDWQDMDTVPLKRQAD